MRRTGMLTVAMLALVAVTAIAEHHESGETNEAIELLKKTDAAVKAIDAVRYEVTVMPSGVALQFGIRPAMGQAFLSGWTGSIPEKFHAEMTARGAESGFDAFTMGGDGDSFFVINHRTRKGYEDMDPGVLGSARNAARFVQVAEFVHDAPFDDEIGAESVELEGTETVGQEECHRIRVVYGQNRGESVWFISTEDHLPRRRIQRFNTPGGDGAVDIVISQIDTAPEIEAGLFKMALPEGYESIDDFHP